RIPNSDGNYHVTEHGSYGSQKTLTTMVTYHNPLERKRHDHFTDSCGGSRGV
ncbi:unnamed protein product, partial [marine sediment metagenome]